ncbi:LTA synthase family protein [Thiovibrio frasassiensis]|uniref:LTA synthase family protein n=1 Tax=Thiovibrio frasassiensis TaxID=2984131 RepID=A0A9X4MNT5_9BACT|nr:LTA synthase family protein [Thiovibrio frasassiensis]MDG4476072.1 LTA synthase family protein [Thiovibrio frasassiensis]
MVKIIQPLLSGFSRLPSLGRFQLLRLFFLSYTLYAFGIRLVLLIRSWPEIGHSPLTVGTIFLVGLFYDLANAAYFAIPLVLYLLLIPQRFFVSRWHRLILYPLVFAICYGLLFSALAEWLFWDEFGVRFNFIAVDYLIYTNEVIGNIRESYPVPLLMSIVGIGAALIFLVLRPRLEVVMASVRQQDRSAAKLSVRLGTGATFLLLPVLVFLAVDGSFASKTFQNRYETELAENGIYQLFSAFRNNSLDYATFYKNMEEKEALGELRTLLKTKNSRYVDDNPTDIERVIGSASPEKRHNVVLIMVESLSAEYLGAFGNTAGLTPNLDALAKDGLLFNRLYATGTRTVRGMEAVTLSVPPTPGRSIVKRTNNDNLFSLGFVFREKGYDTRFFYGGFGYFDNMNAFFGGNGFDITDRSDLSAEEISFANIWGVCDEDILGRALREFDQSASRKKPFFGYVMTTSNHRPFTYPEGKIDIPVKTGRAGGVKYTDYAIGKFIEEARRHSWFDNTIFIVVADHCAGSAGRQELPVHSYHIPMIFYGPGIVPRGVNTTLASQIDLGPTLFGLLKWQYHSKFFGKDILASDFTPRAFIGNYQRLGYLEDGYLAILNERKGLAQYQVVRETMHDAVLVPVAENAELSRKAICSYQGASLLYQRGLGRWSGGEKLPVMSQAAGKPTRSGIGKNAITVDSRSSL